MCKAKNERISAERYGARSRMSAKDLTLCGFFAALVSVGAFLKIEIPIQPYPMHFTLQWFFVLIAGLLLGKRRAAMSVCVYLIIGLVGVPVFASGGGPAYLFRPTFGFLLGLIPMAFVVGLLSRKGLSRLPWLWLRCFYYKNTKGLKGVKLND